MLVIGCPTKASETVTKEDVKRFRGERLRFYRETLGLTQHELDKMCSFGAGLVQRYETGTTQPGADALYRMAKAVRGSTDYLLGLTDDPEGERSAEDIPPDEQALLALRRNNRRWEIVVRMAQEALERETLENLSRKSKK